MILNITRSVPFLSEGSDGRSSRLGDATNNAASLCYQILAAFLYVPKDVFSRREKIGIVLSGEPKSFVITCY